MTIMDCNQQLNYLLATVDFKKGKGLVPVIVQNKLTKQVLMLGYMNEETLEKTLKTKRMHFWSRSRKRIWMKGETSGNFAIVENVIADCDQDTLLCQVMPVGPICHTGAVSCFTNENESEDSYSAEIIKDIYEIMIKRAQEGSEESYVARMMNKGLEKISRKIGEEAIEVIFAGQTDNQKEIVHEATDVLFHVMLLLVYKGIPIERIFEELFNRHQKKVTDQLKQEG